uniref:Uncharacterized protein n=1 Tax=Oryza glumipatula TaxID=40148 RepID=A0A0D9YBT4_9ORYZ
MGDGRKERITLCMGPQPAQLPSLPDKGKDVKYVDQMLAIRAPVLAWEHLYWYLNIISPMKGLKVCVQAES